MALYDALRETFNAFLLISTPAPQWANRGIEIFETGGDVHRLRGFIETQYVMGELEK